MDYSNQFESNSANGNEKTKTVNSFGIYFYVKKYKETNGKLPIYVRITVNKQRAEFSIKRTIEEKSWNAAKGLAKGNQEVVRSFIHYL